MKKKDEIEAEISSNVEEHALWRSLLEHPSWKKFEEIVMEQVRLRQATVCLTPLPTFGKSLEQEFMKGEAAGLGLALALVHTQYEITKLEKEKLAVELDKEMEYEKARTAPRGSRVVDDNFSRE